MHLPQVDSVESSQVGKSSGRPRFAGQDGEAAASPVLGGPASRGPFAGCLLSILVLPLAHLPQSRCTGCTDRHSLNISGRDDKPWKQAFLADFVGPDRDRRCENKVPILNFVQLGADPVNESAHVGSVREGTSPQRASSHGNHRIIAQVAIPGGGVDDVDAT